MKVILSLLFTVVLAAIVFAEPIEKRDVISEIRPGLRYDIMPYYDYYRSFDHPSYYGHHHHRYPPHYPYEKYLYYPGYEYYGKK